MKETLTRGSIRVESFRTFDRDLLRSVGQRLKGLGGQGYLVGGYIRDLLLGLSPVDMDLVVRDYSAGELAEWLHREFGFSHPVRFARFGTYHLACNRIQVEIAPLRGALREDAERRDFTVNCIFIDLMDFARGSSPTLIDPTGRGIRDLERRVLATPSEAVFTFWSDPVRLMRAVRFQAMLGLRLERGLESQIARIAYLISKPAGERIGGELEKILISRSARSALKLMQRVGLLRMILPEIDRMAGFRQRSPHHAYDLFEHTVRTVSYVPRDIALRLSALLHDAGKVETCRILDDRNVYYGHQDISARIATEVLARLRFPKRIITKVAFLAANHMVNYSSAWSDRAVRRFVRKMGEHLDDMLALLEADRRAQAPAGHLTASIAELRERVKAVGNELPDMVKLPVDGREIMRILGIAEGPLVGEAKQFLYRLVERRGRPLRRDECLRLLRNWQRRRSKQSY